MSMAMNNNEQVALSAGAIEAIRKLAVEATAPTFHMVGETEYMIENDGTLQTLTPEVYRADELKAYSLDALVALVQSEAVPLYTKTPIYLSVQSADTVRCYTQPDEANFMKRIPLYQAIATDAPGFRDCRWSFEEAMIALRARFAPTEDVGYMLDLLSHMSVDQNIKSDDNGVTQTVQVKQGVSFVANETVRPIVTLAPYRTFHEVEQPASQFVFRVDKERNVTLYEADGGMWRLTARRTVKQYLCKELADEIAAGRVIVTL